MKEVIILSQGV